MKSCEAKMSIRIFMIVSVLIILGCIFCIGYKQDWFVKDNGNRGNVESNDVSEDGSLSNENLNESPQLDEEGNLVFNNIKYLGDVEISNIKIKLLDTRKSEITATVRNLSEEFVEVKNVELIIKDKDGNVKKIGGIISALNGMEEKEFLTRALSDLTSTVSIEFKEITKR